MKITITLAGSQYDIAQLTLGQLRDLSIGVTIPDVPDPQENVKRSFDRAVQVIATALSLSQPELTVEKLYSMPITRTEMRDAYDAVLKHAGFIPATEANTSGEGQAETK